MDKQHLLNELNKLMIGLLADKTLLEQLEEQATVLKISIHQKEGAKKVYSDLLKNIKED